eukprot:9209474-Pyramimonas_sp.AAC.1
MGPPRAGGHQTVASAILSTVGPVTEICSHLLSLSRARGLDATLYIEGHSNKKNSLPSGRFIAFRSRK